MIRRTSILISCSSLALLSAACASGAAPPPQIALDPHFVEAKVQPEPPKPVQVVAVPQPLPLPGQLKPLSGDPPPRSDPRRQVIAASAAARMQPIPDGFINAVQVWPFSRGALYQLYTSPGRVTDIALQPGEKLTSVSAGDTVRWVIGDTTSGSGGGQQVHVLIKPTRADLKTNLLIYTDRRLYQLEMTAGPSAWMASAAWSYPQDDLLALQNAQSQADSSAPVADGLRLERLAFRYAISGDRPPWRPINAFDDGEKVYIQFPPGIAQTDMPPLFVVGANGDAKIVNYRVRAPYFVVDGLFAAAELRPGRQKAVGGADRAHGWGPFNPAAGSMSDVAPPNDKAPPEALAIRARPRPVTRLSRKALATMMGAAAILVLGGTLWALRPPAKKAAGDELYSTDRKATAEGLNTLPKDYASLAGGQDVPKLAHRCRAIWAGRSSTPNKPAGCLPAQCRQWVLPGAATGVPANDDRNKRRAASEEGRWGPACSRSQTCTPAVAAARPLGRQTQGLGKPWRRSAGTQLQQRLPPRARRRRLVTRLLRPRQVTLKPRRFIALKHRCRRIP